MTSIRIVSSNSLLHIINAMYIMLSRIWSRFNRQNKPHSLTLRIA